MSFGITKTIPASRGEEAVDALYDGTLDEFEFHMAGKPSRLEEGHYVYTIFQDELVGRCRIKELIFGATNPNSGRPRTLIMVDCPGERGRVLCIDVLAKVTAWQLQPAGDIQHGQQARIWFRYILVRNRADMGGEVVEFCHSICLHSLFVI